MHQSIFTSVLVQAFMLAAMVFSMGNDARAATLRLEGNITVSVVNSVGTASVEHIVNYSPNIPANSSWQSRIDVWAFKSPYAGSPLEGKSLFKYVVGDIPGGYQISNVTTIPQQVPALADGTYYLALLLYDKGLWLCLSGSCPDISTNTTYTGYYKDPSTFLNIPGYLVCAGGVCNSSVSSSATSAGLYDGIYLWSPGNFLSLHQDGTQMIAAIFFNNDGNFSFPAPNGAGVLPVPQLDIFDLMGGPVTGSIAHIDGTRFHRACNVAYDFTFNIDSSITVTRIGVSNTPAANSAGISCSSIVGKEAATMSVPKIRFNQ